MQKKKKIYCKMQRLQLKIPGSVVFPVGGDRDLRCERKGERHLGTIISGSVTKREAGWGKWGYISTNCYKVVHLLSFHLNLPILSLLYKKLNWALPGQQGGQERWEIGVKVLVQYCLDYSPSQPPLDCQGWIWSPHLPNVSFNGF